MLDQKQRKKLIVSADDFGKSPLANKNVLKLAEAGKLDRVSVMSNGNFSEGEIERIKKTGVRLDIHLDLADTPKKERKLKKGVLGRGIIFLLKHVASSKYTKKKIEIRWKNQIEKFRELFGRYPDGINSHQHIHLFGRYFRISVNLLRNYNISYLRLAGKGLLGTGTIIQKIVHIIWRNKKNFRKRDFNQPDYFVSLDWIGNMKNFLENIPKGKIEIACHPERKEEFELIKKYF